MCDTFEMPFDCLIEIGLKSLSSHNKLCRSSKTYNQYYQTRQEHIQNHFTVVSIETLWCGVATTYRLNSRLHRTSGPAIVCPDNHIEYFQNNLCHRIDGPAIVYPTGKLLYYQNDNLHRLDGPAIVYPDGQSEYYIEGVRQPNPAT